MQAELNELKRILERLLDQYEEVFELMQQERETFTARDPEGIEASSGRIHKQLRDIQTLDQSRQRLTSAMAQALKLDPETVTLKSLDGALGGRSGLPAYRDRLKDVIGRVEQMNAENRAILEGLSAATDSVIRGMWSETRRTGYNRRGAKSQGEGTSLLSKRL